MASTQRTSQIVQGKKGRVIVDGLIIHLTRYRLRFYADDLGNRTFESHGHDEGDFGFDGCDLDISGNVNALQLPHDVPFPNFRAGVFLHNVLVYLDKAKKAFNQNYNFTEIRLLEVEVSDEAEGKATISLKAKSNGTFDYLTT